MNRPLLALLAVTIFAPPLPAQCVGGVCPLPTAASRPAPEAAPLRWLKWDQDPNRAYLYQGGKQLGAYDLQQHYYRPLANPARETWGEQARPPIPPPCFGVDVEKIAPAPKTTLNGQEIPHPMAEALLARPLSDDSRKLRVTVIDADAARRRQIAEELRRMPEGERFAVRAYDPKAWELRTGHVSPGSPTIYCQAPDGKVLHRQDDYQGGAEPTIMALRKAREGYDPKKDPDLRRPAGPSFPNVNPGSFLFPTLAALLAVYLLHRKDVPHAPR